MTQKSTPETCNTYIMCLIYKYIHSLNREKVHFWFICGFYVEQSTLSGLENCERYFFRSNACFTSWLCERKYFHASLLLTKSIWKQPLRCFERGDEKQNKSGRIVCWFCSFYQTKLNQMEAKPLKWPVPDPITQEMKGRHLKSCL